MKPYLITTGIIFTLLTILHIWKGIAEWPASTSASMDYGAATGMIAIALLPGALACWAWILLRKNSISSINETPKNS